MPRFSIEIYIFFGIHIGGRKSHVYILTIGLMEFQTKRALLEYLGKNTEDRKLVDRLIAKGKVYKDDGMYVLVDRGTLLDEVIRLREENKSLKNFSGENTVVENATISNDELQKELNEVKNDLKFQMWEYERLQHRMNKALEKCYDLMVEKKVVVKEKNPLTSFIRWAEDVDMSDMDEDMPF